MAAAAAEFAGAAPEMRAYESWDSADQIPADRADPAEAARDHLMRERFAWIWRVNAKPLLERLAAGLYPDRIKADGVVNLLSASAWPMLMLFALSARGAAGDAAGRGLPGLLPDGTFRWEGTGAHPPLEALDGRTQEWARSLERNLARAGLAERAEDAVPGAARGAWDPFAAEPEGILRLTETGSRLAASLPKAFDDPDLPLRWRNAGCGPGVFAARDKWLRSAMRKLKAASGAMPPPAGRED